MLRKGVVKNRPHARNNHIAIRPSFPPRAPLAVIDLGSNTFHLAITSLNEAGQIHVIDSQKENLRMAESIEDGLIPERQMHRATEALLAMKSIGQSYQAEFRAIATQAIRASHNRLAFLDHIFKTTGLKLEIIDGVEEARLSFLGVAQSLSFSGESLLSVDIGGASTEIALGRGADCTYLSSLKTGALMLSKRYFFNKAYNAEQLAELRQYVSARLSPIQADLIGTQLQNAAATSGTAKAIARMIHLDRTKDTLEDPHGFRFTAAELYAVELELCRLIEPERIALRWGLDSKRADIVLAGCVILATLSRLLQIPQWTISSSGLREGVALDTYERKGLLPRAHWQDLRWQSVVGFAGKLRLDPAFATQMSDLSLRVYDELQKFSVFAAISDEKLDRELLQSAAYLLEAGKFINYSSYHRHSYYLITESNLLGYTQEEKHLLALVNRFARKAPAKTNKSDSLPYLERNLDRINLLSSCLRIARCLLRTRQLKLQQLKIKKHNDSTYILTLSCLPSIQLEAECLALKKETRSLEKALGCNFDFVIHQAAGTNS